MVLQCYLSSFFWRASGLQVLNSLLCLPDRLKGRLLLDLFSEPDIFGMLWEANSQYRGTVYPPLPDLYGPTMNVSSHLYPASAVSPRQCGAPAPREQEVRSNHYFVPARLQAGSTLCREAY